MRNFLKFIYFFIYEIAYSLPFYLLRTFPINKTKIVFNNFDGKGYGDNPKYIAEYILKYNLELEMVWLVNDLNDLSIPGQIRKVKNQSFRAIYELVTAGIWVDNNRKSFVTRKRSKQYYIQTWHGCMMVKKIEKDAEDKLDFLYLKSAKNDSKMIDLCLSNSDFMTKFYKRSFWYKGDVLQCGFPKTDFLLNTTCDDLVNIKEKIKIPIDKKIVLYAPTFRNNKNINVYILEFEKLLNKMESVYKGDWIVLVRLHPSMVDKSNEFSYSEKVINVSLYSDMQDLLLISDVLITDYSSTMFEFYLMNKVVFLYATDVENYESERGLYFSFESIPFPKAKTLEDLLKVIEDFDRNKYDQKVDVFMQSIGFTETGVACQKLFSRMSAIKN